MAIRIDARIVPNVTRMTRIPRLNPNNDTNVDPNWDEYDRMRLKRHRITRIRHRIVGFGQIWTRVIAELKKKKAWFSRRYIWVCRSCILTHSAYSPVFCSVFGWRFRWILGATRGILDRLWQTLLYSCYSVYLIRWFGSFLPLRYE